MEIQSKITHGVNLKKLINSADEILNDNETTISNINVLIDRVKSAKDILKVTTKDAMSFVEQNKIMDVECQKIFDYKQSAVKCISRLEQLKLRISEVLSSTVSAINRNVGQCQATGDLANGGVRNGNKKGRCNNNMRFELQNEN